MGVRGAPPALGLALAAAGVGMLAFLGLAGGSWVGALLAWATTGAGVGLAYPGLYLRATTASGALTATVLATAAVMTEDFGGLVATSAGAALPAISEQFDLPPRRRVRLVVRRLCNGAGGIELRSVVLRRPKVRRDDQFSRGADQGGVGPDRARLANDQGITRVRDAELDDDAKDFRGETSCQGSVTKELRLIRTSA